MYVITVVLDATNDINRAFNIVNGSPELQRMVEGRNSDYSLRSDSILYVLRNNEQLDAKLWLWPPFNISYGIGRERRGPGMFSYEATIKFEARLHRKRAGL